MGLKRRHGSRSSAPCEGTSAKMEDECRVTYSETKLLVAVESIVGLDSCRGKLEIKYPLELYMKVLLGDELLGTSPIYTILSKEKQSIDYQLLHTLPPEPTSILISQPLSIVLLSGPGMRDKSLKKTSSRGTRASTKQSGSKQTQFSSVAENVITEVVVDLVPLLFGEKEVEERVQDVVDVLVRLDGARVGTPQNILYVTVQNMYNPPAALLSTDVVATTLIIHTVQPSAEVDSSDLQYLKDRNEETPEEDWSKMTFGPGQILSTETMTLEQESKLWFSVQVGPPPLSQYRNLAGELGLRDPGRVAANKSDRSNVFINWNQIKRVPIEMPNQEKLLQNIIENGVWLMEVYVKRSEERKRGKTIIQEPPGNDVGTLMYLAKFDLTQLLHPGVNCTRVVGELELYKKEALETEERMIPLLAPSLISERSSETTMEEDELTQRRKPDRVYDLEGRPSFIEIVVELYTSFRPRKTIEELLLSVKEFTKPKTDLYPGSSGSTTSPFQARISYKATVLNNVKYLNGLYQDYKAKEKVEVEEAENIQLQDLKFLEELSKSGALNLVEGELDKAVTSLIKNTGFARKMDLYEAYSKVVEETQSALQKINTSEAGGTQIRASSEELLQAALEASEEGKNKLAQQFLLKRLYYFGKRDADLWKDVAVLSLRHGGYSRAKQALMTALSLQPRHKDALLMMGAMLSMEGNHSEASILFECLTTFYPRFYKGWFAYYCFFESIENKQGSDACLSLGSVCLNDKDRDEGTVGPLYWSPDVLLTQEDGFILTAVYLLSLSLCQFAEMCLSHHRLETREETLPYLYYLSVSHHLQGKFQESNSHLKQAVSLSWNDERLWNLMGHNLYKVHEWDRAVDCYQFVLDNPEPFVSYSLTFYRMGRITLQKKNYQLAAQYFLKAVKLSPTPRSWTGLAKTSYWMGEEKDAELAAKEANRLDEWSSEAWACLALINYRNCTQPFLARQCLSIAAQCGQVSDELLKEIYRVLDKYGEEPPREWASPALEKENKSAL